MQGLNQRIVEMPGAAQRAGLVAQRDELTNHLSALRSERQSVLAQFEELPSNHPARKTLDNRMIELDDRAQAVEVVLSGVTTQLANTQSMPGVPITGEPFPPFEFEGPPPISDQHVVLGLAFMLVTLLPLSFAFARRIWKKSTTTVQAIPGDLLERMARIEAGVETTALEVERIGEGQRFLTKLMSDHMNAIGENAARARIIDRAPERPPYVITPH